MKRFYLTIVCLIPIFVVACGGGGGGGGIDDVLSEYGIIARNASGYWTQYTMYNGDGSVQYYNVVVRAPNGNRNSWTHYVGAGADGIWFTGDDLRDSYTLYDYTGTLMDVGYQYDDTGTMTGYFVYDYDSNDNETDFIVVIGRGGDGSWFTADDIIDYSRVTTYDLNLNREKVIYFDSNDQTDAYYSYEYDADDNLIKRVYYNDSGLNSTWFDTDDVIYSYYTYTFDTNNYRTRRTRYNGAGINGTWLDSDDIIDYYIKYFYDGNGQLSRESWYTGPGSNGIWYLSTLPERALEATDYNHNIKY